jgi:hypothetical protein
MRAKLTHMRGTAVIALRGTLAAVGIGFAAVGMAAALMATGAQATQVEHARIDDQWSYVSEDFCGDLTVLLEGNDRGSLVARTSGQSSLPRYTVNHHGGSTITNLATHKAFTFRWNYLEQDLRATDNGDGTATVISQIPGPEKIYGPDGQLVSFNGGTMRLRLTIDLAGTPSDPSDDSVVGEEVVSSNGGPAQDDTPFCDEFRDLTS